MFFVLFRVLTDASLQSADDRESLPEPDGSQWQLRASYLDHSVELWQDLASGNTMMAFGIDLANSAVQVIGDSFVRGLPYLAWSCSWRPPATTSSARSPPARPDQVANPQQQMLHEGLPAFFAVISLTFPAGLIVYFLMSNLYRIAQQRTSPGGSSARRSGAGTRVGDGASPPPAKPKPDATKGAPIGPHAKSSSSRPRPTPSPKPAADSRPAKGNPARGPAARPPARPNPGPAPRSRRRRRRMTRRTGRSLAPKARVYQRGLWGEASGASRGYDGARRRMKGN